ncbi:gentisate 1,2-dioxygenase [Planotetraspora silvatica]|uniref:Gentisate 1,2-dioxygenase n=1 Tax=Planotetraspora silvatica TaxID=234614 RepID=A0A8J3UH55_9ACTN|nr:cupin domain-containing protein [Planotetraspora silvatica]GII43602.1 gentisate 1,2-dioxygenase [Planotetraspora silvatica]
MTATPRFTDPDPDLGALYGDLADNDLQPLWKLTGLLTPEPVVRTRPYRWRADMLRRMAERSGQLVGIDRGGDRRVLACANPGLGGAPYATSSMWAAVQYLGAGESAPAHRHTPAALRFVLEGEGVWTLVDGDPLRMSTGDLILTPSMTFHEHHNPGGEPMMWMDVLDLPMVAGLDAVFFEEGPTEEPTLRTGEMSGSERVWGGGPGLLPARGKSRHTRPHSPLLAYRWADTDRALAASLADSGGADAELRFADPTSGGDVMPTMRCEMRRLRAGGRSGFRQQTGSRVATVLSGTGTASIGEESFSLGPGDIFAVPSWARYGLEADEELDVFSVTDAPVLEALGLYREQDC